MTMCPSRVASRTLSDSRLVAARGDRRGYTPRARRLRPHAPPPRARGGPALLHSPRGSVVTCDSHDIVVRFGTRHGRAFLSLFHMTSHGPGAAGAARTVRTARPPARPQRLVRHVRPRVERCCRLSALAPARPPRPVGLALAPGWPRPGLGLGLRLVGGGGLGKVLVDGAVPVGHACRVAAAVAPARPRPRGGLRLLCGGCGCPPPAAFCVFARAPACVGVRRRDLA